MTTILKYAFFLLILNNVAIQAKMTHGPSNITQIWQQDNTDPFDELILSWNTTRPTQGKFLFYISVKTDTWSPWLLYASWGSEGQSSFLSTTKDAPVKVYQDTLEVFDGKKATGFQIKIDTEGQADLKSLYGLHVYTNSDQFKQAQDIDPSFTSLNLKVPQISQMTLNHIRHKDLCSPTSTTAVTQYLTKNYSIDPVIFAQNVYDSGFDIFGNWIFNVAQASTYLSNQWHCWVERLNSFNDIYDRIKQGTPVVVSIRGPLPGSALPYAKGHLIVITGYDAIDQKVLCMDPAFPKDSQTSVSYALSDFIEAWNRRGKLAYIFTKNTSL